MEPETRRGSNDAKIAWSRIAGARGRRSSERNGAVFPSRSRLPSRLGDRVVVLHGAPSRRGRGRVRLSTHVFPSARDEPRALCLERCREEVVLVRGEVAPLAAGHRFRRRRATFRRQRRLVGAGVGRQAPSPRRRPGLGPFARAHPGQASGRKRRERPHAQGAGRKRILPLRFDPAPHRLGPDAARKRRGGAHRHRLVRSRVGAGRIAGASRRLGLVRAAVGRRLRPDALPDAGQRREGDRLLLGHFRAGKRSAPVHPLERRGSPGDGFLEVSSLGRALSGEVDARRGFAWLDRLRHAAPRRPGARDRAIHRRHLLGGSLQRRGDAPGALHRGPRLRRADRLRARIFPAPHAAAGDHGTGVGFGLDFDALFSRVSSVTRNVFAFSRPR
jgi:hypothetical protein